MIQDHSPAPLDFATDKPTVAHIRAWLPDDVTRCRGQFDGKTCPTRSTCARHIAPVEKWGPAADYLCSDGVSLYLPAEGTIHDRVR